MGRHDSTAAAAFGQLVRQSNATDRTLRGIAQDLVADVRRSRPQ